jgi:hypothetical protein
MQAENLLAKKKIRSGQDSPLKPREKTRDCSVLATIRLPASCFAGHTL